MVSYSELEIGIPQDYSSSTSFYPAGRAVMKSLNTGVSSALSLYRNLLGVFQYQYSFHVLTHQITVAFLPQF